MMAQYLTYDEYLAKGGTLDENIYEMAEFQARSRIDWMTLGRVKAMAVVPDEVKMAMMVIMQVDSKYSATAQSNSAIISSFSTDGYSESYGGASEQTKAAEAQLNHTVSKMLLTVTDDKGVPLLYRGID
jgi:hypothetical protein